MAIHEIAVCKKHRVYFCGKEPCDICRLLEIEDWVKNFKLSIDYDSLPDQAKLALMERMHP